MSPDPDDDALRWEGDDDPTLAPGWKRVGEPARLETPTDAAGDAASDPAALVALAVRRDRELLDHGASYERGLRVRGSGLSLTPYLVSSHSGGMTIGASSVGSSLASSSALVACET